MNRTLEYRAVSSDEGKSLKEVLRASMGLTVRQIRSIKFSEEGLKLNGSRKIPGTERIVTTRAVIHEGDVVTAFFEDEGPGVVSVPGELDILYEDEDLVFISKPAGLVAHPAHGHFTDTLVNRLAGRYEEPARLIGRLDKDTSGVIAAARNSVCANRMETMRKQGTLRRQYLALVHGRLEGSGLCSYPLKRVKSAFLVGQNGQPLSVMEAVKSEDFSPEESSGRSLSVTGTSENGNFSSEDSSGRPWQKETAEEQSPQSETEKLLPALTEWTALETGEAMLSSGSSAAGSEKYGEDDAEHPETVTLVRIHLLTGRTHQIRCHMAAMGHPLVGDHLYGLTDDPVGRTLLHSELIECEHPFTGEKLCIRAPLPEDFDSVLKTMHKM